MMNRYRLVFLLMVCCGMSAQAADIRLSSHLQRLQAEFRQHSAAGKPVHSFVSTDPTLSVIDHRYVVLDISAADSAQAETLLEHLQALGMMHAVRYKHLVSGAFPIESLHELEGLSGVNWVQAASAARHALGPPGGLAYNAADAAMFTDVVRKRYNVDGSGVTIGVLSDSYNCLDGAADDVLSGDLPDDVVVLQDYPFCEEGLSDEGRAMMQLVYDIAPGAKQMFYTAWMGAAGFAQGIQRLADAGADIIVDDIAYLTMPMFQDGPIAQSVDEVKARGVAYFSSAGNMARLSYENDFVSGREPLSSDTAHDFGKAAGQASDFYQKITIPQNTGVRIVLQWDDPAEIAGGAGAKTDLDLFLLDHSKRRILSSSQDSNIGHNPVEILGIGHSMETTEFYLYISHRAGPAPKHVKYVLFGPPAPWPDAKEDELVQLSVQFNNGAPTLVMPDGQVMQRGKAVVVLEREIVEINTQERPLFLGSDGNVLIEYKDEFHRIGTPYLPIWFIPEGFKAALIGGELILYRDIEDVVPLTIDHYPTHSGTVYGHANAAGAMAVGAIPYEETPWFGTPITDSKIQYFSSAGGTPIYFNRDGIRHSQAEQRLKPDIVAPDNSDTTFFGNDNDGSGFPNFTGTSAAAPNAAALAGLLKQAFPFLSPDQVHLAMRKGSQPLHDPAGNVSQPAPANPDCEFADDFNWGTGCGLVKADRIFSEAGHAADSVYLTLKAIEPLVIAGREFDYRFEVHNFSGQTLTNLQVSAKRLPKFLRYRYVDGCPNFNRKKVECKFPDLPSGGTAAFSIGVMPRNNPTRRLLLEAEVSTDAPVDLSGAQAVLDIELLAVPGDINGDGCVDKADWRRLFSAYRRGDHKPAYDLDGDGLVGQSDLQILKTLYSRPGGRRCR
ncbi:S8 family serine peptidase [Methylotuvimicrobium sp.]|uniref:S8 family serine peptidase n=1 Tax=Methylotuvimicrobium sp. TaxID=2822413 RepID=UPI003D6627B4